MEERFLSMEKTRCRDKDSTHRTAYLLIGSPARYPPDHQAAASVVNSADGALAVTTATTRQGCSGSVRALYILVHFLAFLCKTTT